MNEYILKLGDVQGLILINCLQNKGKGFTMNHRKEHADRRKEIRFGVEENIFAVIKPHYSQMGQIIDINKKGLSFHYFEPLESGHEYLEKSEVAIFLNKGKIYIDKVMVRKANELDVDDNFLFNCLKKKRLGIEFGDLNFNQLIQLEYFILNHAKCVTQDRRYNERFTEKEWKPGHLPIKPY